MAILRGRIEGGRIVTDGHIDLPDGTEVEIAVGGENDMTPEERADFDASLERVMRQAARGGDIPADEMLRRLREI